MSSANGKKLWTLLAAGLLGSTAVTASAAPYITVSLLGSTSGPAGPYSSSVLVTAPGQVIDYKVQIQLAPETTANPFPGPGAANRVITNWLPSDGTVPTGLNTMAFSITQAAAAGTNQADFDAPTTLGNTGGGAWNAGLAATGGGLQARGNGSDNLVGAIASRANGSYDGIAGPVDGTADVLELIDIAAGTFDISEVGATSVLNLDLTGFGGTTAIMATRWRTPAGTPADPDGTGNVNTSYTVNNQTASVTGADPIIVFNGLTLAVPEPTSLGLLGLAAIGALSRRRRA